MGSRVDHLEKNLQIDQLLPPQALTADAQGAAVDMIDAMEECLVLVNVGTVTDGTYDVVVEESADGTTGWAEADADRDGATFAQIAATDDDTLFALRVRGYLRFIRVNITVTSATTGAVIGVTSIATLKKVR